MRPYLTHIRNLFVLTNFLLLPCLLSAQASSINISAVFNSGISEITISEIQNPTATINISSSNSIIIIKNVLVDGTAIIQADQPNNLSGISSPAFSQEKISQAETILRYNSAAINKDLSVNVMLMERGEMEPVITITFADGRSESYRISFAGETITRINP